MPYIGIGYEGIFGEKLVENFNLRIRPFFYNKDFWPFRSGKKILGIAPDWQFHKSSTRTATSLGVALRFKDDYSQISSYGPPALIFWGVELSLRGGVGNLDTKENDILYRGSHQFLAAEAAIYGAFFLFTGYLGIGLRREFWPTGIGENGQRIDSAESRVYPVFAVGGGGL